MSAENTKEVLPQTVKVEVQSIYGSGSGTGHYYAVEGRLNYSIPHKHAGMILDKEWRRVYFAESPHGVPILLHNAFAVERGLMNYEAALALATWFLALPADENRIGFPDICVEARIVEVEMKYEYSTREIGVGPAMSATDMRRQTQFVARETAR